MHSAKNTVVAILLLGVSYGVYQVINAPMGGDPLAGLMRMSGDGQAAAQPASPVDDEADWNTAALPPPPSSFPPLSAGQTLDEPGPDGLSPTPKPQPAPSLHPTIPLLDEPPAGLSEAKFAIPPESSPGVPGLTPPPPFKTPGDDRPGQASAEPDRANFAVPPAGGSSMMTPAAPVASTIDATWPEAEKQVAAGNFRGALELLTPWHEKTAATDPARARLNQWLDALAGKVVYSVEHHLDPLPYIVKPGDTLDSIAQSWSVPQQLVYNVNQQKIPNPMALVPGTELKQVRGPFNAVVHAGQRELTLYVNGLYAGRFAMSGDAPATLTSGSWQIADKKEAGHSCGPYCLQLGQSGLALHAADATSSAAGGIAFQTADAKDLFNILTVGSTVSVR